MSEPRIEPTMEEVAAAIEAGQVIVCYSRCWGCLAGQHYGPAKWHGWADDADLEYADRQGRREEAKLQRCACTCADETAIQPDWRIWGEDVWFDEVAEDWDQTTFSGPCRVCGAPGACAYDAEGRPMTHVDDTEDDDEPDLEEQ